MGGMEMSDIATIERPPVQAVPLPSRMALPAICPIAFIQDTVAVSYGINPRLMRMPARDRFASWPRQVAMYLARELTNKSLANIGQIFGHRDHTTVIYAISQVEKRMAADPLYRADVEALREALR